MGWIGPVVYDQEHEGWVVPLFADGAQGAGTSSARGQLSTRRPDDGPGNGDRMRLTYRDGSTVEGIWQDGTLLRGDGIVHAHTSGQVRLEVLDQAEQWRPDAAVVGWAAGCTCGWRGTPWTRVPPGLADPAARRLAVPGPWADLEAADENRLMAEWRRHIAGWQALEDVEAAATRQAATARALDEAVHPALTAGASWPDIGRATGLTGPAAQRPPSGRPVSEQPTGHPGASEEALAGVRTVLVVDLDGEPLAPLCALEEILLNVGTWEDRRLDPSTGTEPLRLPAPLGGRVALAAVDRLLIALAPTQSGQPGCGRLLAPDGRHEHAPMTTLTLPAADIDILRATAAVLSQPGLDSDIVALVDAYAEQLGDTYRRVGRADLFSLLARLAWPARPCPHRRHRTAHRPAAGHRARHRLRAQPRRGSRPRPHRRPHEPHLGRRLRYRPLPLLSPQRPRLRPVVSRDCTEEEFPSPRSTIITHAARSFHTPRRRLRLLLHRHRHTPDRSGRWDERAAVPSRTIRGDPRRFPAVGISARLKSGPVALVTTRTEPRIPSPQSAASPQSPQKVRNSANLDRHP
ncbi:hypothetical protein [Blastococcus sp. TF02A-26]|uniref:hypothetical protein n=1 Tax=Blastococcus sp. TF02A-26 TaxID=2250577 RepID=UPI001F207A76|nr:hypothetical protein [Blastococcus sp. TF02A-26]